MQDDEKMFYGNEEDGCDNSPMEAFEEEQRSNVKNGKATTRRKRKNKSGNGPDDSSVTTDVVRSMSDYNQLRKKHEANSECTLKYGHLKTEGLLELYHKLPKNDPDRDWLKEEAFFRIFFLIPHVFKRNYCMPLSIFDDAVMNMIQMVLTAIEMFKPGKGASFSNYLYGPFKAAVAKTFHDTNVVAIPPARRKLLRQAMDRTEEDEALSDYTGILPDMPIPYDGTYEAQDVSLDYEEELHNIELINFLEDAISREADVLTHDERRLLVMHYGLFGHPCVPYKEIARLRASEGKGCAHSRLSQIHTQAIKKLQAHFKIFGIEEW